MVDEYAEADGISASQFQALNVAISEKEDELERDYYDYHGDDVRELYEEA